ncbi:MAG: 3-oxoacyl-[acyl-carrier-protein] reductase [Planctomycetota bacterium]|jgi:3-oxoacyl-[acyl-carrier protein] reductase
MSSFENKVALVTGGSRGIGRAIVQDLLNAGAKVALTATTAERAEEAARSLEAGDNVKGYAGDAKEVAKAVVADFGRVDILVCNAGITRDQLALGMSAEDWNDVIDVNLSGTFRMIQALYRTFMKQRTGRIITISSVVGLTGNAGQSNYAASKGGLISLTRSMAKELGSRNVTANVVAPGFIATDMTKILGDDVADMAAKATPLRRVGTPEDIANVVRFLASDEASYVTGQVIAVDGGMTLGGGW